MIPAVRLTIARQTDEVLQLLSRQTRKTRVIAGGTDIIPGLRQEAGRFRNIKHLIDINHIPDLKSIRSVNRGISIGAAVTFGEILRNGPLAAKYPLLVSAASTIGSLQIRNRATLAGNFVNNAPCADSVPPLLVYNAWLRIRSLSGDRKIQLSDFLVRPYHTRLQPAELVTEIVLPPAPPGYTGEFYKLGRRRGVAISRITLAVLVKLSGRQLADIRLASGAVTPIGRRFMELESRVRGEKISAAFLKQLAAEMGQEILRETGLRWSSPYKLPVVQQVCYQLLVKLTPGKTRTENKNLH